MHAAAVKAELLITGSRSLKDKRKVLTSLNRRIRATFPIAFAEVAHQDTWQRASVGLGFVAADRHILDESIAAALRMVDARTDLELVSSEIYYVETD